MHYLLIGHKYYLNINNFNTITNYEVKINNKYF